MTTTAAGRTGTATRVEVLGVRHHGPGSARAVRSALEQLQPDLVLIEGPPELDALVPLAAHRDLVPPVAALVYAVESPRRAAFYPFAVFSPEWVALQWALAAGVTVRFADLPAANFLAEQPDSASATQPRRPDAIGMLAAAAGYDDPERWWEDAVEHRRGTTVEDFAELRDAMAQVRADGEDLENDRREAAMRKAIRAAQREGREGVAFVCGAYHAPSLHPASFPPASHDSRLLCGLPKVKVVATWAPWTAGRLSYTSGYGAGVRSPGWYQHLFVTPEQDVVPAWFVRVARALRDEDLDASTASAVESARLAQALAAVRGRPSVGLTELDDAARAVLTEGSDVPLAIVERAVVVGEHLGSVPASTPMVPLAADLAKQQKSLRLKVSASPQIVQLDLRRDAGLARSQLLHRLRLLDVHWGRAADTGGTTGTFKEAWELTWHPELAVSLVEAAMYGNTVASATEARVVEDAEGAPDLATLGRLLEECLVADLPTALDQVVQTLAERTALQHDTLALLQAVEPLARTSRYGDVRGVDVASLAQVVSTVVTRAAIGLRSACSSLDDDAAAAMRTAVEGTHRGVSLLDVAALHIPWQRALVAVAQDDHVHGSVSGRANRLLLDAGHLDADEAARRLSRRLSTASGGPAAAAWLDGFLAGEALLLLHVDELLRVVDEWLSSVGEEAFEDLLPLLRRTFARYEPAERRLIGQHVAALGRGRGAVAADGEHRVELRRAGPAVGTVARLLGLADAGGAA